MINLCWGFSNLTRLHIAFSMCCSLAVTHISTDPVHCCLTSLIVQEGLFSLWPSHKFFCHVDVALWFFQYRKDTVYLKKLVQQYFGHFLLFFLILFSSCSFDFYLFFESSFFLNSCFFFFTSWFHVCSLLFDIFPFFFLNYWSVARKHVSHATNRK